MASDVEPNASATQNPSRLARVYAEALMSVANKAGNAETVGEELSGLQAQLFKTTPNLAKFLTSPVISKRQKEPAIVAAFASCSEPVRNLLGVLNQNNRMAQLPAIAAVYQKLLDTAAGRVAVLVRSAVALSDEQRTTLETTLTTTLGKTPVLTLRVDADLLGGLVVQVGDRVYDSSVRTRLQTLRNTLMDRGTSYVLQQN